MRTTVTAICLVASAAAGAQSSPAARQAIGEAASAALQADASLAVKRLREVPADQFDAQDLRFRRCMLQRFGETHDNSPVPTPPDRYAREALGHYRAYWRSSLLRPSGREQAEAVLLRSLQGLLNKAQTPDMDTLEPLLAQRLEKSGQHSLQGRTGPLRELMIWGRQETRPYEVALPEGSQTTKVMLLSDFSSMGWTAYATCDLHSTAGWATKDALYAVVPRYPSLDSEDFRVSFLGHESQHFADLTRYADVPSWQLEYRAKLVELAQAVESRPRLLRYFNGDQGDDPASPHSYANRRVVAAVRQALGLSADADLNEVDTASLQTAAVQALRADTRQRSAKLP